MFGEKSKVGEPFADPRTQDRINSFYFIDGPANAGKPRGLIHDRKRQAARVQRRKQKTLVIPTNEDSVKDVWRRPTACLPGATQQLRRRDTNIVVATLGGILHALLHETMAWGIST